MIRVLIVDDHPTMRTGLRVCLRGEPGLVPVGVADSVTTAVANTRSHRPDVVVLDLHLPGGGGLLAAHRLKLLPRPPRVLVFTAFADDALLVPALIAGADGILTKEAGSDALFEAIRRVHADGRTLPLPNPRHVDATMRLLEEQDRPIATMLLAGVAVTDVAATLRVDLDGLDEHLAKMFGRLQHRGA